MPGKKSLYSPIIFDLPPFPDNEDIIPNFCHAANCNDSQAVAPTQVTPTSMYLPEQIPSIPLPPVKTLTDTSPTPITPSQPERFTISHQAQQKRVNAYDVSQELMAAVPMLLVDECLYAFDGQVYRPMTIDVMKRAIVEHCRYYLQVEGSPLLIRQIYEFLRAEPRLVRKGLRESTQYVAFHNGLLDLESGRLGPFNPGPFIVGKLEANFLPDKAGQCPVFNTFLSSISGGDPLLIQRFWEAIGYVLVPDTAGKVFFLVQGVPNSGKSVLGSFIASCFDDEVVTAMDFNALGQQFGVSELLGKRLSLCMDLPGATWDTRAIGQIKSLTGNDLVSADVKYQPRIKFRNTASFVFGTNHAVVTSEPDPAFFQRMIVLPFRFSVPKEQQDGFLLDKLQQEKDAIVSQAIYAYLRLRRNHYCFAGNFRVNEVIAQEPVANPITGDQAVANFFACNCTVEQGSLTFLEDLYHSFSCFYPNLLEPNIFSNKLFSLLSSHFPGQVKKVRKRRQNGGNPASAFVGLSLLSSGCSESGGVASE